MVKLSRDRAAAKAAAHFELQRLEKEEEGFGSTAKDFAAVLGDQDSLADFVSSVQKDLEPLRKYVHQLSRGVVFRLGTAFKEIRTDAVVLQSGEVLACDVVYPCIGVYPNTAYLKQTPLKQHFGFRDSLVVNDQLQVTAHLPFVSLSPCRPLSPYHTPPLSLQVAGRTS